jgi:hypothetical protein
MATPRAASVLERGNIYFAYRPKVQAQTAHGFDDVQRFYVVISPRSKASYRLIVIGQKKLPAVTGRGDRMAWGFVEEVSSRPEDVEDELDPRRYFTKTRGEREQPAARPAGEGVYAIARHDRHTHFGYVLELPEKPGEVQRALNIGEDGNYIVNVKSPKAPLAPGTGLDKGRRVASFPRNLQMRFRGRRFIPLDPPDFLDHEGAEIVLIGAKRSVSALGLRLEPRRETEATAEIFTELRMEKSLHPVGPLLEGKWE